MKRLNAAFLGFVALLSFGGSQVPALAADNEQKLQDALAVEWAVANCDGQVSAATIMLAGLVINGSNSADVERLRPVVHEKIRNRFTDTQTACTDFLAHVNPPSAPPSSN